MAKSKSFFGLRKGSTKTMTYSVLRGQQITKDRVTDIANPKTMDQTIQRIPFAQAVKFYKSMTKNFFKFAYEDKRPLESDYNAFMRHNVKYAASVSLDNYRNPNYPSFGNYLLSDGSLASPLVVEQSEAFNLQIAAADDDITTIGELTPLILGMYPDLVEGDIVTIVGIETNVAATGVLSPDAPQVITLKQFILDSASEQTLASLDLGAVEGGDTSIYVADSSSVSAMAAGVIFSRNSPSGLKCSTSYLTGNAAWNGILEDATTKIRLTGDAISWGATGKAILQGSLAE